MTIPGGMTLTREVRVGNATVRCYAGGYPMSRTEYEEGGRIWACQWDGRDDGDTQFVGFGHWEIPENEAITPAQRAKILAAVLPFLGGNVAEHHDGVCVYHAVEERRGRCYRISADNTDPVCVEYCEPGHTLLLYENPALTNGMRITLSLPEKPVWNYPPGQPIAPEQWRVVLERIAATRDTGLDSDFSVFIVVPRKS
jgi:hypothetical protein